MTGDRELFVGKWRWYSTTVEEWFDVGPSNWLYYTPQNQGFEYYFTISQAGEYKGYRNDTLIHDFFMSNVDFESFNGIPTEAMTLKLDCTVEEIDLRHISSNITDDTIFTLRYPLKFNDLENHLESHANWFVKE